MLDMPAAVDMSAGWRNRSPLTIRVLSTPSTGYAAGRTKAGLDAAREEGRIGGRRPKLSPQQQAEIRKMVTRGDKTSADAARLFKIHLATVSRLLARQAVPPPKAAKHAK